MPHQKIMMSLCVFVLLPVVLLAQNLGGACTNVGLDSNGQSRYCLATSSSTFAGATCTCTAGLAPQDTCGFNSDCFICPDTSYSLARSASIFTSSQMQLGTGGSVCFMQTVTGLVAGQSAAMSYVFNIQATGTLPNTLYKIETGTTPLSQTSSDCSNFSPTPALSQTWGQAIFARRFTEPVNTAVKMGIRLTCLNSFFGCGFQSVSQMGITACATAAPTTQTTPQSTLTTTPRPTTTPQATQQTTPSQQTTQQTTQPSSTSWAGTYQVNTGCSQTSCCCLTGQISVTQAGTTISVQSPISGQCGTNTSPTSFSFALDSSSATSASGTVLGQSFTFTKSGNVVTATNNDFPSCSGSATLLSSSTSATSCFHESTVVTYKGREYSVKDFQTSGAGTDECKIPHVVTSSGVRVETVDGHVLRLTADHLVFTTQRGLVAAGTLRIGDVLFSVSSVSSPSTVNGGVTDRRETTAVVTIVPESNQVYFGLNCLESVVFANGIRTSTFGQFHTIPALWMKYAGAFFGVHHASAVGDTIVELLARIRVF